MELVFGKNAGVAFSVIALLYVANLILASVRINSLRQRIPENGKYWEIAANTERVSFYIFFAFLFPLVMQFVAGSFFVLFKLREYTPSVGYLYLLQIATVAAFSTLIAIEGTTLGMRHEDRYPENPLYRFVLASLFLDILSLLFVCGFMMDQATLLSLKGLEVTAPRDKLSALAALLISGVASSIIILVLRQFLVEAKQPDQAVVGSPSNASAGMSS